MKRFEEVSRRNRAFRRTASLICVLALLTTTLGFGPLASVHGFDEAWDQKSAPQNTGQQAQQAQQAATAKRPLTHQDYDSWRSIQASQISRDGKFVAYAFTPQDGDGEIVVRNVASGAEWRAPRGYRPPVPPPDDPSVNIAEVLAAQARLVRPVFTADSRYVVFSIEPTKVELNKAKKEKKKPEDMPKTGLGIMAARKSRCWERGRPARKRAAGAKSFENAVCRIHFRASRSLRAGRPRSQQIA